MCMHMPCLKVLACPAHNAAPHVVPSVMLQECSTCLLMCCAVLCCPQEMTLEQYEAMLAEKKAELNKARVVKTIDISEFDNLKVVNKDEEEEENPLEVRAQIYAAVQLDYVACTRLVQGLYL